MNAYPAIKYFLEMDETFMNFNEKNGKGRRFETPIFMIRKLVVHKIHWKEKNIAHIGRCP